MNKIRIQDLTPDVYYNHSRDFQFIGRLFDVVLNSVKTNSELVYNLPISDNSDEKMIDLMTMTLGFKSRHNYNVKQLTALCSAFTTIIRNKGNYQSIELAINALLNAEGVTDAGGISLSDNNTTINLYIPQALTDTNLLKDLLTYILPAGMSCNIIRELQETYSATNTFHQTDTTTIYEGTYVDNNTTKAIGSNMAAKSIIVQPTENGISDALAKSTPGLLATGEVYKPTGDLWYNITYILDGGKITNTSLTPYSYKTGTEGTPLPGDSAGKYGTVTKASKTFGGWYDNDEYSGDPITEISTSDAGNKIFYAKWN